MLTVPQPSSLEAQQPSFSKKKKESRLFAWLMNKYKRLLFAVAQQEGVGGIAQEGYSCDQRQRVFSTMMPLCGPRAHQVGTYSHARCLHSDRSLAIGVSLRFHLKVGICNHPRPRDITALYVPQVRSDAGWC